MTRRGLLLALVGILIRPIRFANLGGGYYVVRGCIVTVADLRASMKRFLPHAMIDESMVVHHKGVDHAEFQRLKACALARCNGVAV